MNKLTKHDYLNPDYMPSYVNEDFAKKHPASSLAYDLHSLISTIWMAVENDGSGLPFEQRGIGTSLEIANAMASDLIERCEMVEKRINSAEN